ERDTNWWACSRSTLDTAARAPSAEPKVMAPKARRETISPEFPSRAYCIQGLLPNRLTRPTNPSIRLRDVPPIHADLRYGSAQQLLRKGGGDFAPFARHQLEVVVLPQHRFDIRPILPLQHGQVNGEGQLRRGILDHHVLDLFRSPLLAAPRGSDL